ncbi:hypothetical protein [Paraburkholderia aromaticivorans]|nr:hypothetical protein [Paraburkholderia aromaticivorans]
MGAETIFQRLGGNATLNRFAVDASGASTKSVGARNDDHLSG